MSLHSTSEVAEIVGVSENTVRSWITTGRLAAINIGKPGKRPKLRISDEAIDAFQRMHTVSIPDTQEVSS